MKSIVIIGCYFGKPRIDAPLFLNSIKNNPTINWILFTDCAWGVASKNVSIVKMSFEELKDLVQSQFPFVISLNAPYKLCDFKPAYGVIFKQYVQEYDFWGHCDFDMLFGDLRHFLTDYKLDKYDRIYYQGHLSLYRNSEAINNLFLSRRGRQYYKDVFSTDTTCVFDEMDGMYYICENEGISFYKEIEYADIYPYLNLMLHPRNEYNVSPRYPTNYKYQVFGYKNGRVYKWFKRCEDSDVELEEYAYIHFSHKSFEPIDNYSDFYITRNGLVPINDSGIIPFEKYYHGLDEIKMNVAEFIFRLKRKIRKVCKKIR